MKLDYLVRHKDLNCLDQQIEEVQMGGLQLLITSHQEAIRQALKQFGADRHLILKTLDNANALRELKLDSLPTADRKSVCDAAKRELIAKGLSGDGAKEAIINRILYENADAMVPGTEAFLLKNGRMLVATREQLQELQTHRDYYAYLRTAFLCDVLMWFSGAGLANEEAASRIVSEFQTFL